MFYYQNALIKHNLLNGITTTVFSFASMLCEMCLLQSSHVIKKHHTFT